MLDTKIGYYVFAYDPQFIKKGIELAPIAMPLSPRPYIFPNLPELTYKRLPALIADSLPDDFGNQLVNKWMEKQGISRDKITPLDRLAYMGKRSMGALEFRPPATHTNTHSTAINLSQLVDSARTIVSGNINNDEMSEAALAQIIQVGTSAGGARAKATIAWNPATEEIRAGQFEVPNGFEHWLLKFDGLTKDDIELGKTEDFGRIEYTYYQTAINAGINMNPCRLLQENGRAHFMTKRFDRDNNVKHHIQTLCSIYHLDYKQKATHDYSQLFIAIDKLQLGHNTKEEAFRRMVFNVLTANNDDHTKNISFMLKEGEKWELSPAYDMTFAHDPDNAWVHQHLMSINGKFKDISIDDMMFVANKFNIGTAKKVIKEVNEAVMTWKDLAVKTGIEKTIIGKIHDKHLAINKLLAMNNVAHNRTKKIQSKGMER